MDIISLIFKLLYEFVPMESQEYAKIKNEGRDWYISIQTDDQYISGANKQDQLLAKSKRICEKWFMKVFFAVMYIYGKRQLLEYTNPTFAKDNDDDDED